MVWWNEGHMRREVRITLVIPSHDRALVRFEKWLNRKGPWLVETVAQTALAVVVPLLRRDPALKAQAAPKPLTRHVTAPSLRTPSTALAVATQR